VYKFKKEKLTVDVLGLQPYTLYRGLQEHLRIMIIVALVI